MPSSARGTLSLSHWVWDFDSYWFFLMKTILNLKHFDLILLFLSECVDLLPICYMKLLNSQKKKKKKIKEKMKMKTKVFFLALSIDRSSWRQSSSTKLAMPAQFWNEFSAERPRPWHVERKGWDFKGLFVFDSGFCMVGGFNFFFFFGWSLKFELLLFEENNK